MPIMTRMRDNMPTVLIILVVAFVITIVFEWGMDYLGLTSRTVDYIGKINNRKVGYQEFVELVRERAENIKSQTGKEPDEDQLVQIRDEVWNSLVNQTLIDEEIIRLGIKVPDEEIVNWVRGENPPEFLYRQFVDSLGNFNRSAYESALSDPRNKEIWIRIESGLRKQREQEKLQSILLAGVRVSESEIYQRYLDQNVKFNADYVLFDPNKLVKDEELEIKDSDIEKYYNNHSSDYKVDASRKFKYVKFVEKPSSKDTQAVVDELNDILRRVGMGADFMELLETYSEVPYNDVFFKHGELTPVKEEKIFSEKVNAVVGPFADNDGYHLIKIIEEKESGDEFIKASHILISVQGDDTVSAFTEAKEILSKIRQGESFSELAIKHSKDPGSATKGGDLGWFGKGRMVKPFEDACYKASVNQVVGPIRTQFGYHIIKVAGKSKRQLKIADITMAVKSSSQTRNEIYQNALDFQYLAKENGFEKEAEIAKYEITETPSFTSEGFIPGIGMNKQISRFAFENKVGTIGEVFPATDGYIVLMISEVKKEGIRPLSEVKDAIRPRVLREKKMQSVKEKVEKIRNEVDNINTITEKYPEYTVQNTGQFTLGGGIPGLGRDLMLIGNIQALEVGQISKPIEGSRGYYIVKLIEKGTVDSTAYNSQKDILANQILQTKKNQFLTDWLENLKKKADIEDNRDMFFR